MSTSGDSSRWTRRIASSLRDLESLDPVEIRNRVIAATRTVSRAQHAGFYTVREDPDGELRAASFQASDDFVLDRMTPVLPKLRWPLPHFDPRRPPRSAQRFDPMRAGDRRFRHTFVNTGYFEKILGPLDAVDQMRVCIYHGDTFIGWLGSIARTGDKTFSQEDADRLTPLIAPISAALVAADRAEKKMLEPGGADFIVSSNGRIEFASAIGRRWLEVQSLREDLSRAIRVLDATGAPAPSPLLRAGHALWTRMHGDGRHRYLVHIAYVPPPSRAASSLLTATQLRVAESLAAGATAAESARAIGVHIETVRTHVKAIYRRLGIASRAELARSMLGVK